MSAGRAPHLSQLVCAATPDPIKAEKTLLREKFVAASAALVTEAKCLPDDKEELWEEKVMWMRRWEQRTGEVFPLVERGRALGIDTKIDAADGPAVVEADEAYERWVSEEIVQGRANEDMRMEEAVAQAVIEQGTSAKVPVTTEKMSHIKVVSRPVQKQLRQTVAESEDKDEPKIIIPPGSILHKIPCTRCMVKKAACTRPVRWTCDGCACIKQGCEKSNKSTGKKTQTGTVTARSAKAAKASSSKRAAAEDDDDDDEVKVVESHMRGKGKALMRNWLDAKVAADLLQLLRLLRAKAVESQAAFLRLQVHIDQLAKALEKIGVE
ncbi:hypothetical protein M404DRAFT_25986 [Pisolithus tinctorius Marx 270]|uniref:Zn(2)-C6 fungal-type domain-containing protein n=1 Tax=Pisolithus tinctorius Marx 270 TaxID=870435 RepID=A0A0C3K5R4_PISTI|nr:hypothetical protein M404DRAFT_25986 [Pisolithus tinctorius Marx 270]